MQDAAAGSPKPPPGWDGRLPIGLIRDIPKSSYGPLMSGDTSPGNKMPGICTIGRLRRLGFFTTITTQIDSAHRLDR